MSASRDPNPIPRRLTPMPYQLDTEKLRALRKGMGLSRPDLAKLAQTSAHTYSRWENGSIVPFEEEYNKLIEALGIDRDVLITDQPNPKFWG